MKCFKSSVVSDRRVLHIVRIITRDPRLRENIIQRGPSQFATLVIHRNASFDENVYNVRHRRSTSFVLVNCVQHKATVRDILKGDDWNV